MGLEEEGRGGDEDDDDDVSREEDSLGKCGNKASRGEHAEEQSTQAQDGN